MEHLLQGIPGVVVYLDDDKPGQDQSFENSKDCFVEIVSAERKCLIMVPTVSFLGHRIDADGLHPLDYLVRAIEAAPTPTSVIELKSYLGLLTYYGKFLPNLGTKLAPLYKLLQHRVLWRCCVQKVQETVSNILSTGAL